MKRRIFTLLLVFNIIFALSGCSSKVSNPMPEAEAPQTEAVQMEAAKEEQETEAAEPKGTEEAPEILDIGLNGSDKEGSGESPAQEEADLTAYFNEAFQEGEVENNGGSFVRVKDRIYFIIYGAAALPDTAIFGAFNKNLIPGEQSKICCYDMKTGNMESVFSLSGDGSFFISPYGFYHDKLDDKGHHLCLTLPDGSKTAEVSDGKPVGISEDGKYVALEREKEDSLDHYYSIYEENSDDMASILPSENEVLEYCGCVDDQIIVKACDYEKDTNAIYSLSRKDGMVKLGDCPHPGRGFAAEEAECKEFLSDEKGVYINFTFYQGSGHFVATQYGLCAVPGKENSLTAFDVGAYVGEGPEFLHIRLTAPGEPEFTAVEPNSLTLSESIYGDLMWNEDEKKAYTLISDFLKDDAIYEMSIQDTAVLGSNAFLVVADMRRNESEDIGWREAYDLKKLRYLCIPFDTKAADTGKDCGKEIKTLFVIEKDADTKGGDKEDENPYAGDTALSAYEKVISKYLEAEEKALDEAGIKEIGLTTELIQRGWPYAASSGDAGWFTYDTDNDGTPELFITYYGSIVDIYGYDGEKAVYSYGCPYRSEATLYDDGMIEQTFGTMSAASNTWYRINGSTGYYLPVVLWTYTPGKGDPENSKYHQYVVEGNWESFEKEYRESGKYPDWAKDLGPIISKDEYEGKTSKGKAVALPKARAFSAVE